MLCGSIFHYLRWNNGASIMRMITLELNKKDAAHVCVGVVQKLLFAQVSTWNSLKIIKFNYENTWIALETLFMISQRRKKQNFFPYFKIFTRKCVSNREQFYDYGFFRPIFLLNLMLCALLSGIFNIWLCNSL